MCFFDDSVPKGKSLSVVKALNVLLRQIVSTEILTYLDDLQTNHQLNLLLPEIVLGYL